MVFERIFIALAMMFLSTIIHAIFMIVGNHTLEWRLTRFGPARGNFDRAVLVWLLTIWMFLAIVIEAWLLASIQAANGVIVFGWTTALIFYFIQRIYKSH
jgi:hypothetical protein